MDKHDLKWCNGDKYIDKNYYCDSYCEGNGICYDNNGTLGDITDYNIVLEFSDYTF